MRIKLTTRHDTYIRADIAKEREEKLLKIMRKHFTYRLCPDVTKTWPEIAFICGHEAKKDASYKDYHYDATELESYL
jgi:hypothetical protein